MTYLRYLCLFAYSGVFLIYFVGLRPLSAVPNAASLSGLSFFVLPHRYSVAFISKKLLRT
jgi:hypothetical protein